MMDINNFGPFNSNVWGSVSDWIMILVTALTALYLIKTFKAQEEIKKIELWKYLDSIKPLYTIDILNPIISSSKQHYNIDISFVIKNINGVAQNVTLDIFTSFSGLQFYVTTNTPLTFPIKEKNIISTMISGKYSSEKAGVACTFKFDYEDSIGNNYKQFIVFTAFNDKLDISPSIPIMQNKPIFKV